MAGGGLCMGWWLLFGGWPVRCGLCMVGGGWWGFDESMVEWVMVIGWWLMGGLRAISGWCVVGGGLCVFGWWWLVAGVSG